MNKRATVLYVQPNSEIGGSDICLLRMIQALDQDRFAPVVVVPRDGPLVPAFQQEGARVRFVEMAHLRTKLSPLYQSGYAAKYWPTVLKLKQTILEEQAAVVHTNSLYSLYGAWAARFAGRPHVWHVREIPPAIPVAKSALAAFVRGMSAKVVHMTSACQTSLFGRHVPSNSCVLYEGLSLSEFGTEVSGAGIRAQLGIDAETPLVGFVGRLDPWKGLDVFVKAAAMVHPRFPAAHFLVAGDAPKGYEGHAREMRNLADSLGLSGRIHFCGFRHGFLDIPQLMASLSMLCHTSVRPEPFGLVLIEAMAMSRPVIATRMGGPLEIIVDRESGFLIAPKQPQLLADSVCRLLANPKLTERVGRAARRRVETQFPVSGFRDKLSAIYSEVLRDETASAARMRSASGVGD
jgi:glycosyltransferase involved in cell wall biosynthesis